MGSIARRLDMKKLAYVTVPRVPAITGNTKFDSKLNDLTGGRIERWMKSYEEFLGLEEIRAAQGKVTAAQKDFDDRRKMVMKSSVQLENLQAELKTIRGRLDRVPREDNRYLTLATEEHNLLQIEKQLKDCHKKSIEEERDCFDSLSAAVRESHDKERARAERTKYWSIIGSVTGTVIGVLGSSLITRYRMKEIRTLLEEAKETAQTKQMTDAVSAAVSSTPTSSSAEISNEDLERLGKQLQEMQGYTEELRSVVSRNDFGKLSLAVEGITKKQEEGFGNMENNLEKLFAGQEKNLSDELKGIKNLLSKPVVDITGSGTVRSNVMQDLLDDTEQKLEWQMKMSTLSTVVFIYGAFALTLPILYSIFK
ncbi:mitochondrial potassium channel-like [Saccoglossus kowalevskii]|uniref:Coiled-coil domain-containing protein 51-like n=1 Tax=Saccoglossus kowalevskii TaxID=10224 RepID=A0ABM0GY64_SACKO|nr:PREDICTED: coiled-coil domain-containing protein 51-like [Saccoglossus kowalevskii]